MNQPASQTPQDLRPIEAAVEALAQAERASAPATLEDRVFMATRADVAGIERPLMITVRRRTLGRLRLAAGIALVAGVGSLWVLWPRGTAPTPSKTLASVSFEGLENEVEFLLAMGTTDEGLRSTNDTIDSLFLDTLKLGNSLESGPSTPLLDEGSL